MEDLYSKELEIAMMIAQEAGGIMLEYFDVDQKVKTKVDNSPVTIADKMINSMVIKRLASAFPKDGVVGEEESTAEYGMGRRWVCDPIDGTIAFIAGLPTGMFSLALVFDGVPVLGVAYDPFLNKMYTAIKGGQSEMNGKKISVSKASLFEGRLALGGVSALATAKYFHRMVQDKLRLITFNGAVYKSCLVARGRLIGFIEPGANAHDVAAIHAIVEGAGGKITGFDGSELDYSKPFKGVIVSNGIIQEKLIEYCGLG